MNDEQIKAKVKEFYDSFFNEMCKTVNGNIGENSSTAQTFKGSAMEAASRIVAEIVKDLGYRKQG